MSSSKEDQSGQVTLTQMLGALNQDVATHVGKKLKKLTKRKQLKAPDDLEAAKIERKVAYSEVTKDLDKWEPIVKRNRKEKLNFPLDRGPDVLEPSAESSFKPRSEFEQAMLNEPVDEYQGLKLTTQEKKYLKSISAEEAKERIQEMQKTRVLLSSFGAKMKRQKKIKSKSYRRLLKQERLRKHMNKLESSDDRLLDEIERLKRLRAQERASLRHKNTGKWAKHAKFRAKYDEEARNKLVEQIGVAGKLLNRPASPQTDSDEDSDDESLISDGDDEDTEGSQADSGAEEEKKSVDKHPSPTGNDRLIVTSELIDSVTNRKRKLRAADDGSDLEDNAEEGADEEEDEQRKLMSEAFADDDVVGDFKKLKSQMADEEQPKDVNQFLPGWGDWAGPGIKINRRKKKKYIIKAKKVERQDESLSNVIISEKANEDLKEFQVSKVPRGVKNENQLVKLMSKPVVSTFVNQTSHRKATRPRIATRLGARIEPLSEKIVQKTNKAKWV